MARDPHGYEEDVSRRHALAALSVGAPPDEAVPVLIEVLADRDADTPDRMAAAHGLGRIANEEATAALTAHLRDRDPRVQQAVAAELGKVGRPDDLKELHKLPIPADEAARRQLEFAAALIAHRHGLDGPFLPEVEPLGSIDVPKHRQLEVSVSLQTESTTEPDLEALVGSTWGISLADRSYSVSCGGSSFTVFVNDEAGESVTSLERVFERPLIAGILARWYPSDVRATPRMLVLTRPEGRESARLEIVRTDGRVDYVGEVERTDGVVSFRVSSVERPAAADTRVVGRVSGRGVSLEEGFSAPRRDTPETTDARP
ncbi:MAG: HEAT repeat domain-containing protein [Nitriliruptorales bacterium]|nr:HEAT repeat domain-containing protein [Nitriliruptorales bacterium]